MNKYLLSASDRYEHRGQLINPISKVDAKIIWELLEVVKKLDEPDLNSILSDYKFRKDEEVLELLIEWNSNFQRVEREIVSENGENSPEEGGSVSPLVKLQNIRIPLFSIQRYELENKLIYDDEQPPRMTYLIVINKGSEDVIGKTIHSNLIIEYESEENRDIALEWLDEIFEEYRELLINNNDNKIV